MSRRGKIPFLFLLLCLSMSPLAARADLDPDCKKVDAAHRLLTGDHGLNYYEVGQAIVTAFNRDRDPQDKLVACTDAGSIENVKMLAKGQAAFALVQSDVAHAVWFKHPVEHCKKTVPTHSCEPPDAPLGQFHLLLITPLFTQVVHVLIRPHFYISSVADLRHHTVWVGNDQSGGYLTAERVLAAAGLSMDDVKIVPVASSETGIEPLQVALVQLQKMDLDAVFFTGSAPTTAIQAAFAPPADAPDLNSEISFLPLSVGMVTELSHDSSYVETMIPKNQYGSGFPGRQGIATVGVEALLLTSDDPATNGLAQNLVNFLAGNMDGVRKYIPHEEHTLARLALVDAPTPAYLTPNFFLPLARDAFYKNRWDFWRRAILWTAGIVIFLFILFCWQRKRLGKRLMKKPDLFFAFLGIAVTWVAGSFTLWAYERHVNGDFATIRHSLGELMWYLLPWFVRTPVTANGQTATTVIRYVMLVIFGGALWPHVKKFSKDWLWPRLFNWLKGHHFAPSAKS
jgi:TRAP transporter TAXI family solute receptor